MLVQDIILLTLAFTVTIALGALLIYLYRRIAIIRRCPVCHENDVSRRSRKGWLRQVPFVRAYFCDQCGTRFVRLGSGQSDKRQHRVEPPIRLMRDEPEPSKT